jgi:alpha-mannosidase
MGLLGLAQMVTAAEPPSPAKLTRTWDVYILPHSHVDIGYTHLQPDVLKKQWQNLEKGIELARKTAGYPEGSRFKWNTEVLWPADTYLRQATPEKRKALIEAMKAGWVGIDALYGNLLTGLCRPEELLRSMDAARQFARQTGVTADAAMISDVPGYVWGIVPAMAHCGVKYFSIGPNWCDRIGWTMATCQDKPFYWVSPSGKEKVLCWIPYDGYALGHKLQAKLTPYIAGYLQRLEKSGYPYDIVCVRWSVGGDNGPPDEKLADAVKQWNAENASVRLIIATTSEAFRALEKRYGDKLPTQTGDFSPYWEDGAASSARETAVNRASAERLVQTETLAAMLRGGKLPAEDLAEAWRNVLLYSEHTWGAHNSISEPELPFVLGQWKIKQAFALDADTQSRRLLQDVLACRGEPVAGAVDVLNTCSWARSDLVVVPKELSAAGDVVKDSAGQAVPSQRLCCGGLAFLARDVPPLAARRYSIHAGPPADGAKAKAEGNTLSTSAVSLQIDPASGAIQSLRATAVGAELSDAASGVALNRYYYVLGDKVKEPRQSGPVKITVKEAGPLVASLLIESEAPGCVKLLREVRVVAGLNRVELINTVDKKRVREKEGLHFGFAFNVPAGTMRVDVPWAVIRPEADQMPGACKNWLTAGRWVDVSNESYGVTWATLDAPLVEVGKITADKFGSQSNPKAWLTRLEPSQTVYSWVMNNHWHTNYRAYQEGPTVFRYALLPHGKYDPGAAQRFGIEQSQPLIAAQARGAAPAGRSLLVVEPSGVIVSSLMPSADGKALLVRLFNATGGPAAAALRWSEPAPATVVRCSAAADRGAAVRGLLELSAWEIVTLRVE